ncbi:MAG: hypothetical protein L0G49_02080 [Luteococcus sp.]|uniref:hypothetical protein n=1 Tax=Luteococcus sp. TaxID=1969402 RepID=UPI002647D286|nr:hypothetical protein [Luteococcus sp.]MDN5562557.1 hypothetical protein [Luteococcus sp.]
MADSDLEVVKWYTAARKVPSVIGRTKDGTRIPGGPFKVSAVLTTVGIFVAGKQLLGLGMTSGATPWIVLVAAAIGAGALVSMMPTDGRNPINVVIGALNQVIAPRTGRIDGKPIRLRRPHIAYARALVRLPAPAPALASPEPATPHHERVPAAAPTIPAEPSVSLEDLLATPAPSTHEAPDTGSVPRRSITALSGVQQLLASLPTQE